MRILYLPHFEFSEQSDFCSTLRSLSGTGGVMVGAIVPNYRYRWQLWIDSWRRLLSFGWRAMRKARGNADIIAAYTHLVMWPMIAARLLGGGPRLVLVSFIYTERPSRVFSALRRGYFRSLLSKMDLVVVHSRAEVERYQSIFGQPAGKFVYVPLAAHFSPTLGLVPSEGDSIVSAGRSNRDYDTLLEVAARLDVPFKIICDSFRTERPVPPNVAILRDCHEESYLELLSNARMVVIPLKDEGLSSGQMVLLHSMAFGKAVVVTATPEVADYMESGKTGLTVERGDASSLETAIVKLLDDRELGMSLGRAARTRFLSRHTLRAGLAGVEDVIAKRFRQCD
jgi:glycosyltransferase involved in cell wall biosynthesis